MSTSTRESRGRPFVGDVRRSKKRKIARDANRNRASNAEPHEEGGSMPHVPIDVDVIDDDVVVSSPTAFAQARNNSRRNRERTVIIDVESSVDSGAAAAEERMIAECLSSLAKERIPWVAPSGHRHRRVSWGQTIIDCDLQGESVRRVQPSPPPPLPPPKEPIFSCPICMGSINEAMSTKCGHIFCQECLKAAIAAQKKCPTCRAKITNMKTAIRVYLPTTG